MLARELAAWDAENGALSSPDRHPRDPLVVYFLMAVTSAAPERSAFDSRANGW